VVNIPLLLAYKIQYSTSIGIVKKAGFLHKWQRTLQGCTSHCIEVTTGIGASVVSLMTIIDVSFECL
jgi:hypothetical protein